MILADTCVLSLYRLGHPQIDMFVDACGKDMAVMFACIAELMRGVFEKKLVSNVRAQEIQTRMELATAQANYLHLPPPAAEIYGHLASLPNLRNFWLTHPRANEPAFPHDIMIAACAIFHQVPIATNNVRHFAQIDRHFNLPGTPGIPGIYDPMNEVWVKRPKRLPRNLEWLDPVRFGRPFDSLEATLKCVEPLLRFPVPI